MARARSQQAATEGRFLAARVTAAKRRGMTNAEIARIYGINERTVRKIRSGETSGRKTFRRLVGEPREPGADVNLSIQRVILDLGRDENGAPVYRSVNAKLPMLRSAKGKPIAMTQADIILFPNVETLVNAEIERLERQYGNVVISGKGKIVGMRPVARRKAPLRFTVEGQYAP